MTKNDDEPILLPGGAKLVTPAYLERTVPGYNDLPNDDSDEDRYCTICGGLLEWVDCWQCGGDGEFDLYDEDPLNFSPGEEYENCDVCGGEGGYWDCANLPHNETVTA